MIANANRGKGDKAISPNECLPDDLKVGGTQRTEARFETQNQVTGFIIGLGGMMAAFRPDRAEEVKQWQIRAQSELVEPLLNSSSTIPSSPLG
jgi:hypothetical protein